MPATLLTRFPRPRGRFTAWPVIPPRSRTAYPDLAADFAVLDRVLTPAFAKYDVQAQRRQNRFRLQQVFLMGGSVVITALGGVQAACAGQRWPGVLLSLTGIVLSTSSLWAKETAAQQGYLKDRIRAERLRALYFQYLSRTGPYAGDDRESVLELAILAVDQGKEPR